MLKGTSLARTHSRGDKLVTFKQWFSLYNRQATLHSSVTGGGKFHPIRLLHIISHYLLDSLFGDYSGGGGIEHLLEAP